MKKNHQLKKVSIETTNGNFTLENAPKFLIGLAGAYLIWIAFS